MFKIAFWDHKFDYKHGTFVYRMENKTLYLTLQNPITVWEQNFHVYEIQTFPMTVQKTNHIIKLENVPKAIAISEDKQYYYELTEKQLE